MNYTKFLKWGVIGGLFLTLIVPFIVAAGQYFPSMFFPYITGKNFAFRILVEVVFALYALLALREAKYRPHASLILWAVGLFAAWMAIATGLSMDPIKSFWGNFERMDGYINLLHLFLYFTVAGAVLSAEKLWEKAMQSSVAFSILQGLIAISQVFHWFGQSPSSQSGVRADGTFGNATYLAVYMLFNLFITLFLVAGVLKEKNALKTQRVMLGFYSVALVLQFLGLFFTETRGTILGLVGGLIVAALYMVVRGKGEEYVIVRRVAWGILGSIVVLAGLFFAVKDTAFVRSTPALGRLASISLQDKTTVSRFIIWNMAFQGVKEKPVFGWGQENFSYVFNKYYSPEMYSQEQWFDRAHNEFLDWMVAGGVPAFLLYISLFLLAAWAVIRAKNLSPLEQAALLGVLAAYAFNNLFVFDNLVSLMYFYLLLALAHSVSQRPLPGSLFWAKPGNDQVVAIAVPIVFVVLIGGGWMLNGPAMARAQVLIEALTPNNLKTGAPQTSDERLNTFSRALALGELGKQETMEQLFQFASNSIAPSAESPDIKQKAYTLTHDAGVALTTQRKDDARLELFMGVFYNQFGRYDDALAAFTKSLSHSPNKQQIIFQAGITYLQLGRIDDATTLFKRAYDLEPKYPDARILYASSLYYANKKGEADALLNDGFGTVLYDDNRLLQTYAATKQFDRVVGIWQARVAASPNDTNVRLGLAGAFFASGNVAKTIATIREVEQLDPTTKAQMESIISQIQSGKLKP